ncbi:MAG: winged helix-turn-helix domain-containing protein, partial [Armatimonadota bacterium]|nr:winged helix-turn-helix domain-containing protein [Armatimonadota bacterium]
MNQEGKEKLLDILKGKDYWTTKEVRHLILERFKVGYSITHIGRLLICYIYIKPYPFDYRRQKDAKEIFLSS